MDQGGNKMKDKTKDFQEYIKQDFNVVEDYKASKEITPKEALKIVASGIAILSYDCDRDNSLDVLEQALTQLEEYIKRDTPMKQGVLDLIKQYEKDAKTISRPIVHINFVKKELQDLLKENE